MASYFSEHLVVHGDNLESVSAKVKAHLDSVPAGGDVELVKGSQNALYYQSLTKQCRILAIVYDLVTEVFPDKDAVLCSNLENGNGLWAVWKDGKQLFTANGYVETADEWTQLVGGPENDHVYSEMMSVATTDITARMAADKAPSPLHEQMMATAVALEAIRWKTWLARHEGVSARLEVAVVGRPDGSLVSVGSAASEDLAILVALAATEDLDDAIVLSGTVALQLNAEPTLEDLAASTVSQELNRTVGLYRRADRQESIRAQGLPDCPFTRLRYSFQGRYMELPNEFVPARLASLYPKDFESHTNVPTRHIVVTLHELVLAARDSLTGSTPQPPDLTFPVSVFRDNGIRASRELDSAMLPF